MKVKDLKRGDWIVDGKEVGQVDIDLSFAPIVRVFFGDSYCVYERESIENEVTILDPAVGDILRGVIHE